MVLSCFKAKDIKVQNDEGNVVVQWGDDHESTLEIKRLRGYCPCAECQGHGGDFQYIQNSCNGISKADLVGRYAILFYFSDGHSTGIFRWEHLRKLDPTESEKWGLPEAFMRR